MLENFDKIKAGKVKIYNKNNISILRNIKYNINKMDPK